MFRLGLFFFFYLVIIKNELLGINLLLIKVEISKNL